MKPNYDLINGLFTGQKKNIPEPEAKKEQPITKRTFKILDEHWEDFLILTRLKGKTQAELLNDLIQSAVSESAEEIEKYKTLVKK